MIHVRMKPQSNVEATVWYSRLLDLKKGYTSTSRSEDFGTIVHIVKLNSCCIRFKQGSSRSLRTEVDDTNEHVRALLQDLVTVGAVFPITEASAWSL